MVSAKLILGRLTIYVICTCSQKILNTTKLAYSLRSLQTATSRIYSEGNTLKMEPEQKCGTGKVALVNCSLFDLYASKIIDALFMAGAFFSNAAHMPAEF